MTLKLVTGPTVEPVSLAEAKTHLRVDIDDDDAYISGLIAAAREYLEGATRRAFLTQTWRLSLDAWPWPPAQIELPLPPLQAVNSIKYRDSDGTQTTVDSGDYIVDTDSEPGRIVLDYGESWPSETLYPANPIQIEFEAGYGDAATDVPQYLRQAVLLLVGHWYENREPVVIGTVHKELPLAVDSLIYLHRAY